MLHASEIRRAFLSGFVLLAFLLTAAAVAQPSAAVDAEKLLQQAQGLETSNFAEFSTILQQLNSRSMILSPEQRMRVRYLTAFQLAYRGDNKGAVLLLDDVIEHSSDAALRLRALSTQVNVLTLSFRYEEAFTKLNQLLDLLPRVTETRPRLQALGVASLLYSESGQYDLALSVASRMLKEESSPGNICHASFAILWALHKSGKFSTLDPQVPQAVSVCISAKEPIFVDSIRSLIADYEIRHGQVKEAIKLLQANAGTVRNTHYPRLISEFNAVLAQAYWEAGDPSRSRQAALDAVAGAIKNEYTEPLTLAYRLLYQIDKQQGNLAAALGYHEKYMAADKGYLNDVSAKALAYQTVRQQVLAKKSQVDALAKQNQILELQQELDHKAMVTSRLYILLLLSMLVFIVFLTYRIKRSQLSFKRQARRDGLTGICNRQHFLEEAERQLRYCAKAAREASLVLIDLDHFKRLNDTFGHAVGDRVLRHAVQACQAHLRSTDVFGRLGGEEFGVLMPECTLDQIDERVEQLRLAIVSAARDDALGVAVTASFGVAVTVRSGCDLRQLLVHADDALYEAKSTGRNRAVVFDPAHGAHMERMRKSRVSMPGEEQEA